LKRKSWKIWKREEYEKKEFSGAESARVSND
jgi:hypothetical protein